MCSRAAFGDIQYVKGYHLVAIYPRTGLKAFLPARAAVNLFGRHYKSRSSSK
jgi:hypothetical protein